MQHTHTSPTGINSSAQIYAAAMIVRHYHRRAGTLRVIQLIVQQALCNLRMLYRAGTTEPTTDIRLRHLPQLQPQHILDDTARLGTQAQAVERLAGIVVGHDHIRRSIETSDGKRSSARQHHTIQKARSEEHTSELQSPVHIVCRLLLE